MSHGQFVRNIHQEDRKRGWGELTARFVKKGLKYEKVQQNAYFNGAERRVQILEVEPFFKQQTLILQTIQKMKSLRFYFGVNFGLEEREHEADVRVKADNITLSH